MSQVKVSGNASGTGIFEIAAPNSNTNYTLTLPQSTGTLLSTTSPKTGNVLQVVQTYKNDVTTISTTGIAVSGLSVSITPSSSSSKILITSGIYIGTDNSYQSYPAFSLRRNSTQIGAATGATGNQINSTAACAINGSANQGPFNSLYISHQYLDSPATTSAITYDWYLITNGGYANVIINRVGDNTNNSYIAYGTSFITVMEIAA